MLVSRNVVSVSDTSAVNLMVGWWLFACSMNCVTSSLFVFQIENISSIYLFQTSGFTTLRCRICDSTVPIKMLAKATVSMLDSNLPPKLCHLMLIARVNKVVLILVFIYVCVVGGKKPISIIDRMYSSRLCFSFKITISTCHLFCSFCNKS